MAKILDKPQDLQEWAEKNVPDSKMTYEGGYWPQIIFIRDKICALLFNSYEIYKKYPVKVISTHTSKSITLPVFRIELPNGIIFTLRDNFHNWKVSVNSPVEIKADFMDLFDPKDKRSIDEVYCEGFPKESVYGCYAKNKKQFTVEIGSDYELFTFFFILSAKLKLRE